MDKKQIFYIIGGIAVIGGIIYFVNKNNTKPKTDLDSATNPSDSTEDLSNVKPVPRPSQNVEPIPLDKKSVKKLTAQELEMRLQEGCGKKPSRKKNKVLYEQCRSKLTTKLRTEGSISFDGIYSYQNMADDNLFLSFDSNLDLNL